jgi:transposase
VFGAAHPHHAYLFANRLANRLKMLVHDGIGTWLAARWLNGGQVVWPHAGREPKQHALTQEQHAGLVVGLPRQRIGPNGVILVA